MLELVTSQAVHVRRETPECCLSLLPGVNGIGEPQCLIEMLAPGPGHHRHFDLPFEIGQIRFLPLQACIVAFHTPALVPGFDQSARFVLGESAGDLDPGLAQVEVAVQLAPQTLGQRLVVPVVIVEQVLHRQTKQPDLIGAGEWRARCDLAIPAPDELTAVAGDLPAGIDAFEFRFQGQGGRVGGVARQKVIQRAGQAALADGVRAGDDVDAGVRRLERESGLDARQGVNRELAKMHQPAFRRSGLWSRSRSRARYPACRSQATGSGASPSAARLRQTDFAH